MHIVKLLIYTVDTMLDQRSEAEHIIETQNQILLSSNRPSMLSRHRGNEFSKTLLLQLRLAKDLSEVHPLVDL